MENARLVGDAYLRVPPTSSSFRHISGDAWPLGIVDGGGVYHYNSRAGGGGCNIGEFNQNALSTGSVIFKVKIVKK